MKVQNLILVGAALVTISNSALGSIIDDKSQFVGDFTVIDFETRGDGTPVTEPFYIHAEEYRDLGVSIRLEDPPHEFSRPFVAYLISSNFLAAQEVAGSPLYVMAEISGTNLLRFDFDTPANAVGLTVLSRSDHGLIELEAYDATGLLIDEVFFLGDVIDGTILGSDYGHVHDVDYGFFGVFTPETEIAYALLRGAPHTVFDDVYFGLIPEPTTGFLLIVGVLGLRKRRRQWARVNLRATGAVTVLIVAGLTCTASGADISGKVTGFATPFDGTYLPDTEGNPPVEMDLEGVHVWLDGAPAVSTYTAADGTYEFNSVPVSPPVTVKADLVGEWARVDGAVPVPPSQVVGSFPAGAIDFTFNPATHTELGTAQVNAFVHVTKAHNFWTRFGVTGLDPPVESRPGVWYYGMSTNLAIKGGQL